MQLIEDFLRYVKIDTCSDEESDTSPSTEKQHHLAQLLVQELEAYGLTVTYDREHCYVYAHLPATPGAEKARALGLIAHMDTSPAMSGANVNPRIVKNYDGGDILLHAEKNIVLSVKDFPELSAYQGQNLIVTDGTTLLGADDKAGIAEIMNLVRYFTEHPEEKHGKICIGFTPDEEIGRGPDFFDLDIFGADVAYTVDGGALGEIEYENFNAAGAKVYFHGKSVHPGYAKGKMINAVLLAQEFQQMLPVFENPMYTQDYEGFYHLDAISGTVEACTADYIIRDHDREKFERKKALFQKTADYLNEKYGSGTVTMDLKDSYYNMKEPMGKHMELIDLAVQTMEEMEIPVKIMPIRGGTDGARLTFLGLPCPNLCTGGENFHGKYEYISVSSMERAARFLIRLAQKFCQK